jgi:hypothetical protein
MDTSRRQDTTGAPAEPPKGSRAASHRRQPLIERCGLASLRCDKSPLVRVRSSPCRDEDSRTQLAAPSFAQNKLLVRPQTW